MDKVNEIPEEVREKIFSKFNDRVEQLLDEIDKAEEHGNHERMEGISD